MLCRYPMLHTALSSALFSYSISGANCLFAAFSFAFFVFLLPLLYDFYDCMYVQRKIRKKAARGGCTCCSMNVPFTTWPGLCARALVSQCAGERDILTRKQQKLFHSTPRHRRQRLAYASAILHLIAYSPVVQIHREIFHKRIFLLDSAIVVAQSRSVRSRSSLFELNTYCTSLLSSCAVVEMSDYIFQILHFITRSVHTARAY